MATTKLFSLGDHLVNLKQLSSEKNKAKGFMGWSNPPDDSFGMLFVNPSKSFWMKNVPFDLDLVGIDEDGKVAEIQKLSADDLTPVSLLRTYPAVIELRSGWCKDNNVTTGTHLKEPRLNENNSPSPSMLNTLEQFAIRHPGPLARAQAMNTWAQERFGDPVGKGAGRMVYGIDAKHVLKVLRTYRPNNQNENEASAFECLTSEYAAVVYDYDKEFGTWVVAERLEANPEKVRDWFTSMADKALGVMTVERRYKGNGINALMYAFSDEDHSDTLRRFVSEIPWFEDFYNKITQCEILPRDFHAGNWGFRNGVEHPILLDYGFKTHSTLEEERQQIVEQNQQVKLSSLLYP